MSATLRTVDRALQVLQQFRAPADALTVTEIADRLGIHRTTASRLVSTLAARGFLERTATATSCGSGPRSPGSGASRSRRASSRSWPSRCWSGSPPTPARP